MRKTRLVILPGVRSITQIGCLLLFLACPTIAFKGQEKRDVEPMCKFHESKYWWLPFDTGEGKNSTIPQKWPGYECQRDNMAITNEKDNVTDSIQHSCDDTAISHRRVAIHGQDKNHDLETNFRRNKMRVIYSLPSSEMPSKRIGASERRITGRHEVPQTVYNTERVSQTPVERSVGFYKYQRSTTDRQAGFSSEQGRIGFRARTMIQNRFQQNRREGSEMREVTDRRRLVPERRDESKKIRLSTRLNTEFTGLFQNLEIQQDSHERSEQSDKRVSALVGTDKNRELNGIRRYNNSPQQDILQRLCSSPLLDRSENAQRSCPETRNSKMYLDKSRIDRRLERNSSPTRQERRKTSHDSRFRIVQRTIQEKQLRVDRRRERVISLDNERSLSDRRTVRSVDSSLERRMREDNIQRNVGILENDRTREARTEILRESRKGIRMNIPLQQNIYHKNSPVYKTNRETTNRSEITIIQRTNDKEQSRMVRKRESTISRENEGSLSDRRRPKRSVDSLLFSHERKLAESDILRDSRIRERDISRENIPPLQNRRLSSFELRENTQRSPLIRVQSQNSIERSRTERRLERDMNNDNEQSLFNRRSMRSLESLERRMGLLNLREDIRKQRRDISRYNSSPLQQRNLLERRENIRESTITITKPKDSRTQSRTGGSLERVANNNDEQRLSNRREERRLESREVSINRRIAESNQRRDINMNVIDTSRDNASPRQNMLRRLSSPERRENIQVSSFIRGKDTREQSRIDRTIELSANKDNEQRLFNRRSRRSFGSRVSSPDRRLTETNQRRDIRLYERDISREDALLLENKLQRRSSPERRENIQRSSSIAIQLKDSRERSRIDRRDERVVNTENEQRLPNRSIRSVDSRASPLDRREDEPNQRRDIRRLNERDIYRENSYPLQNILRRLSSPERRENIQRSSFMRVQPKDSREQSRISRRFERGVSNDNERHVSNRRSARLADSRVSSLNRRVEMIKMRVNGISRDYISPVQNTLQQQNPLDRRETILLSQLSIIKPVESRESYRTDRRLERVVSINHNERLSNRRAERCLEFCEVSLDRRMGERRYNIVQKRDISRANVLLQQNKLQIRSSYEQREMILRSTVTTIHSRELEDLPTKDRRSKRALYIGKEQRIRNEGSTIRSVESRILSLGRNLAEPNFLRDIRMYIKDTTRRIRPEIVVDNRNDIRENISPIQNRRLSSYERRENTQRLPLIREQSKNFMERSRTGRRLERAMNNDNEQTLFYRRSMRSLGFLDRRMGLLNHREDIRKQRMDISRDTSSPLQERNLLERREYIRESTITITKPKDSRTQSRTGGSLERVAYNNDEQRLSNRREEHRLESREVSINRRIAESNRRRDININLRDISRDDAPLRQNMLRRLSSPERRENIQRSSFIRVQGKDSAERSRSDRRIERAVHNDNQQRLSNRRSIRSVDSRVSSPDRRVEETIQRRDIRMHERDISREDALLLENKLQRRSSFERRENIQRSSLTTVQPKDSRKQSGINSRLELAVINDNEQRLSNRRSIRSDESRVFTLERKLVESDNQRSSRICERDLSHENISSMLNMLRRLSTREQRNNILRSAVMRVQPKDSKEQSRIDRRLERAVNNDNQRYFSDRRRSLRSVESRSLSLDQRIGMINRREDTIKRERDISRETCPTIQQRSSNERRDNILHSRIYKRFERGLPMVKEQLSSARSSADSLKSRVFYLDRRITESNLRRDNEMYINDRHRRDTLQILKDSRNTMSENASRLQNSLRHLSSPSLTDRRDSSHRSVFSIIKPTDLEKQSRVDMRLKLPVSIDNERSVRSVDSRVFLLNGRMPESRMDRRIERAISIDNKNFPDMRRSIRSRDVIMYRRMTESRLWRDLRIHEKDVPREESFPRSLQAGIPPTSTIHRFRERRTVFDSVNISPERKFETPSRRNKLDNVDRREDVSRFNKRHTQERRIMLNRRSISERTNEQRLQTSSADHHLVQKPSSSRQRIDMLAASPARVSRYELHLPSMLDMSQNYDEAQVSNSRKSALISPSWNGKQTSAFKKAVTNSNIEETILKDSGLKYSQGLIHERQIRELRPDSEIRSNDKGHLLQDLLLGSVIAGFFISSTHQKLRSYRNFICIF